MRRQRRILAPILATAAMALLAMPALAGNQAVVEILEGGTGAPVAGEEHDLRAQLLQHGVTPVNDGTVQVIARSASGDEVVATATSVGGGEWTATLVFPTGGEWEIAVTHSELETTAPSTISVANASIAGPSAGSWAIPLALALAAVALVGTGVFLARRGPRIPAPAEGVADPG
jgi:hypothetical protein